MTGEAAFQAETPWARRAWLLAFLDSMAAEAAEALELLRGLDRSWRTARTLIIGRRRTSHAAAAIDLLAAALGIAVKNAARLLDEFCGDGIAIEVTHRAKRRLFALANLAPLRESVAGPRRPEPFRGRGRPPLVRDEVADEDVVAPPLPARPPVTQAVFEYNDLEAAIAEMDVTIRRTRAALDRLCAREPRNPFAT